MRPTTQRKVLRLAHLAAGLYLGTYVFSPLHGLGWAQTLAQVLAIGLLISGVVMWQQGRINRFFRGPT